MNSSSKKYQQSKLEGSQLWPLERLEELFIGIINWTSFALLDTFHKFHSYHVQRIVNGIFCYVVQFNACLLPLQNNKLFFIFRNTNVFIISSIIIKYILSWGSYQRNFCIMDIPFILVFFVVTWGLFYIFWKKYTWTHSYSDKKGFVFL